MLDAPGVVNGGFRVRYTGQRPPETLKRWCDANADKVRELEVGTGYTFGGGAGKGYDVLLREGWRMGDDLCHTIIEPTVTAMLRQLRAVEPCDCSECQEQLAKVARA